MTAVVQEAVSGIRLVKSFGGEEYEDGRFREASDRYARGMMRVTRLAHWRIPITETVGTGVAVIVLWFGAREVLVTGTHRRHQLIAFLALALRMLQPLKQLSQVPTVAAAVARRRRACVRGAGRRRSTTAIADPSRRRA